MKFCLHLEVFFDEETDIDRFKKYDPIFSSSPFIKLKDYGKGNLPYVDKLLRCDKPDTIIIKNKKPVFGLEYTREVPTGHNHTQRYGRIACASEEKVMSVFFAPWKSMKHGKNKRAVQKAVRDLICQQRMAEIHQIPILSIEWPTDKNYEVIEDTDISDKEIKNL